MEKSCKRYKWAARGLGEIRGTFVNGLTPERGEVQCLAREGLTYREVGRLRDELHARVSIEAKR
jgi:hypothetical protein